MDQTIRMENVAGVSDQVSQFEREDLRVQFPTLFRSVMECADGKFLDPFVQKGKF